MDFRDGFIRLALGVGDSVSEGDDVEDASSVGANDAVFVEFGTRVEDLDVGKLSGFVESEDFVSLLVRAGVSFAGHNDADGGTLVPNEGVESAKTFVDRRLHDVEEVGLES